MFILLQKYKRLKPILIGFMFKLICFGSKRVVIGRNFQCISFPNITVDKGSYLQIADDVLFRDNVEIKCVRNSKLKILSGCLIDSGVRIVSANFESIIDEKVKIGFHSVINAGGGLQIGKNTSLYGFVYIQTSSHIDSGKGEANKSHSFIHNPVKIGRDCLIGAKSTILPGTTIEDNSFISFNKVIGKY